MSREFVHTIEVSITQRELDAIRELEKMLDLSEQQIVMQALRFYDAISKGYATVQWPQQECKIAPEFLEHK